MESQCYCYIIYSSSIDKYYIGYTTDIEERIRLHNIGHFGAKSYSHRARDWDIFLLIPCENIKQAVYIETRIKRMKSRIYIQNLKRHPEIVKGIIEQYSQ